MKHRYMVMRSDRSWVVFDREARKNVYRSDAKSSLIAEAQKRNGFATVDGDERTYGGQLLRLGSM
jgi:hypothetical protein